jgi:hypothetical protein
MILNYDEQLSDISKTVKYIILSSLVFKQLRTKVENGKKLLSGQSLYII